MDALTAYVSSIPSHAKERVKRQEPEHVVWQADYFVGAARVGSRTLFDHGCKTEFAFKRGKKHGWQYCWHVKSFPGRYLAFGKWILTGRMLDKLQIAVFSPIPCIGGIII